MPILRRQFFSAPKKALLIKFVTFLGFGGMVGFCVLGCEKPAKGGRDVVRETEDVWEMTTVYAPPLEYESDVVEPALTEPVSDVLAPKPALPDREEISVKYGAIPLPERDMVALYGAPAPKD